jgi:hydrogenase nickel incorporation protein HypA/HybF
VRNFLWKEEHADGRRVQRVCLEIGRLSAVVPDAIRFCFEAVARGTLVEGALLDIVEVDGLARCRSCASETRLEQLVGRCAACDSPDLECVAGEELNIKEMEVA